MNTESEISAPSTAGQYLIGRFRDPLAKPILEAATIKEAGKALDEAFAKVGELDLDRKEKDELKKRLYADYGGTIEDILGS